MSKLNDRDKEIYISRALVDDVDFEPEFYQLKELFPNVSDGVILDVLEATNNDIEKSTNHLLEGTHLDEVFVNDIADIQLEDNTNNEEEDFKMALLMDAFPNIEYFTIKQHLQNNDNDLDRTLTELLSYNALKDAEESLRLEVESERKANIDLNDFDFNVGELMDITDLDQDIIETYYNKNNRNVSKCLVDIILTYSKKQPQPVKKQEELTKTGIPTGGRVQASYSIPLYEKKEKKKHRRCQRKNKTDSEDVVEKPYNFNENSPEVRELAEFVFADKFLVEISWEFLKDAIIFFKGDISRVISVAIYILENGGEKETFIGVSNKPLDYSNLSNQIQSRIQPSQSQQHIRRQVPIKQLSREDYYNPNINPELDPAKAANLPDVEIDLVKYQAALQRFQLRIAKERSVLDLHRFHVKNAKATAEKALDEWWEDELKARQANGNTSRGVKVREVNPFLLITGKGLHSIGGVSKVRSSIKAMLKNSSYIFEEEPGQFLVTGKNTY